MSVKIFFCYAHEDELFLNQLKSHLRSLQRQGLIDVWHDRDIGAGADWEQEITKHLHEAEIIILMISSDFMNSEYCYSVELKQAIERHERKEAFVIPVILRSVYWQGEPLGKLQALPTDAKPITGPSWHNLDEALLDVVQGIQKIIDKLKPLPIKKRPVRRQSQKKLETNFPIEHVNDNREVSLSSPEQVKVKQPEIRSYRSDPFKTPFERTWRMLRNPFTGIPDLEGGITSRVSGRYTDIREIVTGGQSAIILIGPPRIGKSSLIRYLQKPASLEWSWRDELQNLRAYLDLDDIHFIGIDLSLLDGFDNVERLLDPFIAMSTSALQSVWHREVTNYTGLKGLRDLLRYMTRENSEARYFIMLDNIERLQGPDMRPTKAQTPQERGLALLDDCGVFRVLVDLLDEFSQFGVILSYESLPLPKISEQFRHVSADLARFRTLTLQTFTFEDAKLFLAQEPESFGVAWSRQFRQAGGNTLFSEVEQEWMYEQAGTHPYLLHQYCFHMFQFKREYALRHGAWTELQKQNKNQLVEHINERLSTFLSRLLKRVEEALANSTPAARSTFYQFIVEIKGMRANEEIDQHIWDQLGQEVRYILYSEGIVRYDPLQPIYAPGSILLKYLAQNLVRPKLSNL